MPTAFTYDQSKHRFLVANPRMMIVEVFAADGRGIGAFGQLGDQVDQQRRIESLHIDRRGVVYIVDSHQGKVLLFKEPD